MTMTVLAVLTGVVLTLVSVAVSQLRVVVSIGKSIDAFYAADTGIERVLFDRNTGFDPSYSGYLDLNDNSIPDANQDSFYEVTVTASGGSCLARYFCIKSIGRFQNIKRAIMVEY